MDNDKRYNGWHNYETWNVKLWLDNDEPSYRFWRNLTTAYYELATDEGHPHWTPSEHARIMLADKLKLEITESAPELGASMYSDLLGAALSEVDWLEISNALLEGAELVGYESMKEVQHD